MRKTGFWFCFMRTSKLRLYYATLKFEKGKGSYKDYKFVFEIADTTPKRRLGLSFRSYLAAHEAMLFVYPTISTHLVWMMNMRFGIDILWLDKNRKILHMVQNAPRSYSWSDFAIYEPKCLCGYVLELPQGAIKRHGFKVGSKISFQIAKTPS